MADFCIYPSKLHGNLFVPSSKSHTMRAILFGALAKGTSTVHRYLPSPDTAHLLEAIQMFGARVKVQPETLFIEGVSGKPTIPDNVIECGNSGILLRFLSAIAALLPGHTILTGDHSIRHKRPMKPLLDALHQLGASATSSRGDGFAPIIIKGPLTKQSATLDGSDSQPISALLIASALRPCLTEIFVTNPGEKPWVDLTLDWLHRLGIQVLSRNHTYYRIEGNTELNSFTYTVPGDFSSAAFPIAAALLTQSKLILDNLDINDAQGDRAIIPILEEMGACFTIEQNRITVHPKTPLQGIKIDINPCVDALPILAVIATSASTPTEIYNGAIARNKESDRIAAIAKELTKMGAKIKEKPDGLIIYPSKLKGAILESHQDHRLALSLAVAALTADSPSCVRGMECTSKTYPNFFDDFKRLGARIE